MKKYWVYIHTCPNGKKYVGITTRSEPERRWGRNGEGYEGQLFGKAVRKYGWSSITHEVFQVDSKEEMYYTEKYLIAYYHTTEREFGYNLSSGGEKSALGCIRSEEYRKKMSEAQKKVQKKVHSDLGYRKKISEVNKEKYLDPEYRKYRSEVQKKVHLDPEYRRKVSEAKKGRPHKPFSEDHKRHIAEAAKNRPRVKIKLPDGTIVETTKSVIVRNYVNKGRKFEYVFE